MRTTSPLGLLSIACFAALGVCCASRPPLPTLSSAQDLSGQDVLAQVRTQVFETFARDKPGPSSFGGQPEGFVGREDLLAPKTNAAPTQCVPLKADPVELIAERARHTNIVIINESHSSPRDRRFISDVLKVLRRQGYSVYAAETFDPAQDLRHPDVLGHDGWYSNEPTFGKLVREARSLGYSLVAYEQTQVQREADAKRLGKRPGINERDKSQTDNLMAAIFDHDRKAKVIIHVGHSHVRERKGPRGAEFTWMAERLKAATGVDPLTIDQTVCESPGSAVVVAESSRSADGSDVPAESVDLLIGHPGLRFRHGRPEWRQLDGDSPVDVPPQFLTLTERVILEARPWGTPLGTVPRDRLLLFPGEHLPLLLPPGSYRVDAFLEKGRVDQQPVRVEVK